MVEELVKHPSVIDREIVLKGVPMSVWFWFYPPYDATREDPGFDGEIEIDSVWMDDYNVINLMGSRAMLEIEAELWKLLDDKENV